MPLPPLVEPAPVLSTAELERYSRHAVLPGIGLAGQRRLKNAKVLVVGAGGLGSPVLLYLAAAGVGTIGIIDHDVVETSNLQRQVIHGGSDVGRSKVESARSAVLDVNPHVHVRAHELRLDASNALEVLRGYDVVVDGADNFATRYLVGDACEMLGLPCVWGSIFRFDGQVSVFWSDPPTTSGYPAVRYRDVFPYPPAPGTVPSCAEGGVLGVLCGAIGSAMANEVVKLVTGTGEPLLGRLLVHDALAARWREVPVAADPLGEPVTALTDLDAACALPDDPAERLPSIGVRALAERLAARDLGEDDFDLVDVREPAEHELVAIPGARLIPRERFLDGSALADLSADRPLILHCKSGARSAEVLGLVLAAGYDAVQLTGGVLAWVDEIEPAKPRY